MVKFVDHMFFYDNTQFFNIVHKPGVGVWITLQGNKQFKIMPMPVLIGAFAKYLLIFLPAPCRVE